MREIPSLDEYFVLAERLTREEVHAGQLQWEKFPIYQEDEDEIPFTCRRISARRKPKERIQSILKSAFDEYCKQFHDMEAQLDRAKSENKELAERNNKQKEELQKAKEQHCKQFLDMEVELVRAKSGNKELDKRNNKLQEELNKANGQYRDMEAELARAKSENKELTKRNNILQEELHKAVEQYCKQFHDMEVELVIAKAENKELDKRNNRLEEELDNSKEQYCKQFRDTEAELAIVRLENLELAERSKKLEEDLHKAKEKEESSERNHEQTRSKLQELCITLAAVKEECDQVWKQQENGGAAPQLSKKRKYDLRIYEINECVNCPICLEPWTQSGEHNVCSLPCGHFFGRSCITQWITKTGTRGFSKCPLCSSRATLKEIRNHSVSQTYAGDEEV